MEFLESKEHVLPESFKFKVKEIYNFFNKDTESKLLMFYEPQFMVEGRETAAKEAMKLLKPGGVQPLYKNDLFECIHGSTAICGKHIHTKERPFCKAGFPLDRIPYR